MDYKFSLTTLSYDINALEPVISSEALDLHYNKHLLTYIDNLNNLLDGSGFEGSSLDEIVRFSSGAIFNNGAQAWNHAFYFDTLIGGMDSTPTGTLLKSIEFYFGSFDDFKKEFERQGTTLFGSGWVWLSKDNNDKLIITQEQNAGNPMRQGLTPLLTFDVWEHAYYVDYRNRRAEHLSKMWDIVNWGVVEARYDIK